MGLIKCPKCGKEIDSLRNIETGATEYRLSVDVQGDILYEIRKFKSDGVVDEYQCPECDEVLFFSESEAFAFLKGGGGGQSCN